MPHRAPVCPNLWALRLDVDQNVSVTANAPVSRLALIRNVMILVRDRAAGMRNVGLLVTLRCAFAPVISLAIHLSNVIPDRVSFKKM